MDDLVSPEPEPEPEPERYTRTVDEWHLKCKNR